MEVLITAKTNIHHSPFQLKWSVRSEKACDMQLLGKERLRAHSCFCLVAQPLDTDRLRKQI